MGCSSCFAHLQQCCTLDPGYKHVHTDCACRTPWRSHQMVETLMLVSACANCAGPLAAAPPLSAWSPVSAAAVDLGAPTPPVAEQHGSSAHSQQTSSASSLAPQQQQSRLSLQRQSPGDTASQGEAGSHEPSRCPFIGAKNLISLEA